MSAAHTPGPWRYDYEPGYCGEVIASNGQTICTFVDEPLPSNARLIATAPEMLEVLQKLCGPGMHTQEKWDSARSVIAKATGAQS